MEQLACAVSMESKSQGNVVISVLRKAIGLLLLERVLEIKGKLGLYKVFYSRQRLAPLRV